MYSTKWKKKSNHSEENLQILFPMCSSMLDIFLIRNDLVMQNLFASIVAWSGITFLIPLLLFHVKSNFVHPRREYYNLFSRKLHLQLLSFITFKKIWKKVVKQFLSKFSKYPCLFFEKKKLRFKHGYFSNSIKFLQISKS